MHDGDPPPGCAGGPAGSHAGHAAASAAGTSPDAQRPLDLQALARDWITLWQSEVSAAATDRELAETWRTLAALWAGVAGAMMQGLPRGLPDGGAGIHGAGAVAASRTPPPAAAPDPRDVAVDRLARRIAELERRLADIEGDTTRPGPARPDD